MSYGQIVKVPINSTVGNLNTITPAQLPADAAVMLYSATQGPVPILLSQLPIFLTRAPTGGTPVGDIAIIDQELSYRPTADLMADSDDINEFIRASKELISTVEGEATSD